MATDSPYSFRQENFDQEWIEVRYNSSYFYDDIYDLNIGQNPTLNFEFSLWQEQGPTVKNSTNPKWGEIFGEHVLPNAILDRLLHHPSVINIVGRSYRMKDILEEES